MVPTCLTHSWRRHQDHQVLCLHQGHFDKVSGGTWRTTRASAASCNRINPIPLNKCALHLFQIQNFKILMFDNLQWSFNTSESLWSICSVKLHQPQLPCSSSWDLSAAIETPSVSPPSKKRMIWWFDDLMMCSCSSMFTSCFINGTFVENPMIHMTFTAVNC